MSRILRSTRLYDERQAVRARVGAMRTRFMQERLHRLKGYDVQRHGIEFCWACLGCNCQLVAHYRNVRGSFNGNGGIE